VVWLVDFGHTAWRAVVPTHPRYWAALDRGNLYPLEAPRIPSGASPALGRRMVLIGRKATRPRCLIALAG